MNHPCSGCALTAGACANREPSNHLTAAICVRAGIPFYCHETDRADWRDAIAFKVAIMRRERVPICQGWVREVRKLAAIGYFRDPEVGKLRRRLGDTAIRALDRFIRSSNSNDEYGRANALQDLEQAIGILFARTEAEERACG